MNNLDHLKSIYKPYRYTIRGKCMVMESTSGNFVVKERPKNKDIPKYISIVEVITIFMNILKIKKK